jgi:hypothetical protein
MDGACLLIGSHQGGSGGGFTQRQHEVIDFLEALIESGIGTAQLLPSGDAVADGLVRGHDEGRIVIGLLFQLRR